MSSKSKLSASILKGLIKADIFEEFVIQEDRVNFEKNKQEINLVLSEPQQKAFDEIEEAFITKDVCLLHGITASGKTEIYIKQIEKYLSKGEQILYLLPEIALTTQLVSRLTKYFGNKVAVFHSKYSNNERVEVWQNVLNNSEKAAEMASRDAHYGQWFADNPRELSYYLADKAFESPEILRVAVKKSLANRLKVRNFGSAHASKWSLLPDIEYIVPKNIIKKADKFEIDQLPYLIKKHK